MHLRDAGFDLTVVATEAAGSATRQAADAIARGAEVVFACGGDGTLFEVLQAVAGTPAALGVLPGGTANAFARFAGIPKGIAQAATAYANSKLVKLPLVSLYSADAASPVHFLSMAGMGADGLLVYRMLTAKGSALGRWSYALHALRLFLRKGFSDFQVEWTCTDGRSGNASVVTAMALRIDSLGGVFPGIARGATPWSDGVRMVCVRPPAKLGLLLWLAGSIFRWNRWNPLVISEQVSSFRWIAELRAVHLQADGEWLGSGIDAEGQTGAARVNLLLPQSARMVRRSR